MQNITVTVNGNQVTGTPEAIAAMLAGTAKPSKPKNEFVGSMRDRRLARRESTPLGGLTSVERKALAATLPKGYTQEQWVAAVAAHKAAK